jgi:hypothetical protein
MRINVNEMMETVYRATRVAMSVSEQRQFYEKYIRQMYIEIDDGGNLSIRLKGKM